ncbi:MAG: hypothetical protein ACXABO_01570 [Promethearchaeota archaeon]|jgi:hypothetical protein
MSRKRITGIIGLILIVISLDLIIPIFVLSSEFSKYGLIDESLNYEFDLTDSSSIKRLNLNVEMGNIQIKYVNPPVDYVVNIEVNLEIRGILNKHISYLDYFTFTDEIVDSQINFIIKFKPNINILKVLSLLRKVEILVFLRADVIFDINVFLGTGNLDLTVPFGVIINNLDINITTGNSLFRFNHCTVNGNISGIVNLGEIELNTYNVDYSRNIFWTLITNRGEITVDITHLNQSVVMSANVTGTVETNVGDITLNYEDNTNDISAMVLIQPPQGLNIDDWPGFDGKSVGGRSYLFTSLDFPARISYNLSFNITGADGLYDYQFSSLPYHIV